MARTITIPIPAGSLPMAVMSPEHPSEAPTLLVVPSIFGPAQDLIERLVPIASRATVVVPDPFWRTGEGAVAYDNLELAINRLAEFDPKACTVEMAAAATWAREQGNGTVIALGICFGGPFVLQLAADGAIDGLVTWHGSRMEGSLGLAETITCPVRHHLGSADSITPPEVITAITDAFATHEDAVITVHEGADHGFSHDGASWDQAAYDAGHASLVELLGLG